MRKALNGLYTFFNTLDYLLCVDEFNKSYSPVTNHSNFQTIIKWAEQEVISGNESESLLILASLSLDKTPDIDEACHYLDRFIPESVGIIQE